MPTALTTTRKKPLTNKQREVMEFIERRSLSNGYAPSTREIQTHFRYRSQTAAVNHLKALEKKGVIQRIPRIARGIVPLSSKR